MRQKAIWSFFLVLLFWGGLAASCDDSPAIEFSGPNPEETGSGTRIGGSERDVTDSVAVLTDSDGDETVLTDTDTDTDEAVSTDAEPQDRETAEPMFLEDSHSGWKNPGCWSQGCHSKQSTHNSNMKPNQCAKCHGENGAKDRIHALKCLGCHEPVVDHNPTWDFFDSTGCPACHG